MTSYIIIYVWLALLTLGNIAMGFLLFTRRSEEATLKECLAQMRDNDRMDQVLAMARSETFAHSAKLQRATRNLIAELRSESKLLEERHWTAINAIEQLIP